MNNNITKIKGIENGRAKFAFDCVNAVISDKKYKSHIKKVSTFIMTNGLGATLAFIFGKDETYKTIYSQIEEWLKKEFSKLIDLNNKKLVDAIVNIESSEYRAATIEVLSFINWLKRFADGLIEGGDEGNE